jgi:hypothetical protein
MENKEARVGSEIATPKCEFFVHFSTARKRKELKLGHKVSNIKPIRHANFHLCVIKGTTQIPTSGLISL